MQTRCDRERFVRTEMLLGPEGMEKLSKSRVAIFGIGGVGGYVAEALARSGVGAFELIDNDTVSVSNINRQIIALTSTVGQAKVDVAKKRATDINPDIIFIALQEFITPENINKIIPDNADYIIDAIDFVPAKVSLAIFAKNHNIPILTCLGTGNRLDATKFRIADIYTTSGCPLARKMRYELKKAGVTNLEVLYSDAKTVLPTTEFTEGKRTVGSISYVPSVAGLLCAGHIITKIMEK
jgi:tRNA A37 threonylcarbamoyladenosine dehydratase